MIDAGTISASLILDTAPFARGIDGALGSLSLLGITGGEQGQKISTLGDALAAVGGRIYTEFQSPFRNAAAEISTLCTGIADSVAGSALQVMPSAQATKNNILLPLRETVSEGRTIMGNFGQGLINGLTSKQSSIFAKAKYIAENVAATMRKSLGIASPSRVMREVGRFTGEGMVLGLQDMSGEVEKASKGLAQSAVTTASVDTGIKDIRKYSEPDSNTDFPLSQNTATAQDTLSRKLDTLIDLLSNGRQSIEIDRRTFGTLVREYT